MTAVLAEQIVPLPRYGELAPGLCDSTVPVVPDGIVTIRVASGAPGVTDQVQVSRSEMEALYNGDTWQDLPYKTWYLLDCYVRQLKGGKGLPSRAYVAYLENEERKANEEYQAL